MVYQDVVLHFTSINSPYLAIQRGSTAVDARRNSISEILPIILSFTKFHLLRMTVKFKVRLFSSLHFLRLWVFPS